MGNRILIVEDEPEIAGFLVRGLREEGFHVEAVADGILALQALQSSAWDVIILDWWLPGMDGLTLLRKHRQMGHQSSVLFLTARDAVSDRVQGLDAGADDYLCKPFAFAELLARVRALSRRQVEEVKRFLTYGDIEIDWLAQRAKRSGIPLELRPKEFALLSYFVSRPQQTLSRAQIYEQVWKESFDGVTNTLEVHVMELRRILEAHGPRLVHTMRGRGYYFGNADAPVQEESP